MCASVPVVQKSARGWQKKMWRLDQKMNFAFVDGELILGGTTTACKRQVLHYKMPRIFRILLATIAGFPIFSCDRHIIFRSLYLVVWSWRVGGVWMEIVRRERVEFTG